MGNLKISQNTLFVEGDAVVVLATSVTATTGVLAVLADATLSHRLVSLENRTDQPCLLPEEIHLRGACASSKSESASARRA